MSAVGPASVRPRGLPVVDGSGCTLLPGLIDSHVHIEGAASLRQSLIFGVTTVFDMFCDFREAIELRRIAGDPKKEAADFLTSGTLVTAPGGHGTEYGLKIPTISAPREADAFVEARISEGSDFIKIVYDDGSAYGRQFPTIDRDTLSAVIQAAHARGRMAVVHALGLDFAMDALDCSADGLVHLFIDTPPTSAFSHLLSKDHAFVIPTLTVLENVCGRQGGLALLAESDFGRLLSDASIANLKAPFRMGKRASPRYDVPRSTIHLLVQNGVPVLAGTDSPNPGTAFGASIHRELELLVDAGMKPEAALASATSVPAEVFRLVDCGRIATGARADMLMVRGDPTKDIRKTRQIVGVWRLGRRVHRG